MTVVTVSELRRDLDTLLQRVEAGEELLVVKDPRAEPKAQRPAPGAFRGQFTVPDDFCETDEEIIRLFEGEESGDLT